MQISLMLLTVDVDETIESAPQSGDSEMVEEAAQTSDAAFMVPNFN